MDEGIVDIESLFRKYGSEKIYRDKKDLVLKQGGVFRRFSRCCKYRFKQ